MALRGPESLPHTKKGISKPRTKSRTAEPSTMITEDLFKHSEEAMDNVPYKESKRNIGNVKKTRKDGLLSTASSPSLRSTGQDYHPHRMSSYPPTPTTYNSISEDRDNTFIPTSREEAEEVGMKIICIKFYVQPATAAGGVDKAVGQDSVFPKRRYTSTGPSLALVTGAGGAKVKVKTNTGPPDVYLGARTISTAAGTDSLSTSPILNSTGFTWNLFGGSRIDDRERKTTDRRKTANDDYGLLSPSTTAAEDFETPATINTLGWKSASVSSPRLEKGTSSRPTEFGGGCDEEGSAVFVPEPSDIVAPSSPLTSRPTLVIPISTPTLATTTTTTTAAVTRSPESKQTSSNAYDNPHSDSSSSISVSSPVFAHSANESDLDDETFSRYGPGGGATSAMSGVSGTNRPRKGYRYGGYHVQAQMKVKNESEDDPLVANVDRGGIWKAAEIEVEGKLGDDDGQQARREEKKRKKGAEREEWIALDMVNDNGSFKFSYQHGS